MNWTFPRAYYISHIIAHIADDIRHFMYHAVWSISFKVENGRFLFLNPQILQSKFSLGICSENIKNV